MHDLSKTDKLKFYFKLKQQECIIENSLEAFLLNPKTDIDSWNGIRRDIEKLEQERQKTSATLKNTVSGIYEELKSAKAMVSDENIEKLDLDVFKNKLKTLWKNIEEFKNSCVVDSLVSEQSVLDADLAAMVRTINKHQNYILEHSRDKVVPVKTHFAKHKRDVNKKECESYDDVEDFVALLAKTGHTGNWSDEDHMLFVKQRRRHKKKGIAALVSAIQARCPDLTEEAIVKHETWYKRYLELRDKQKQAVQEWRKRKEAERAKLVEVEVPRPRLVSESSSTEAKTAEDIEKKKERLRLWKEQKLKTRAEEEEKLKSQRKARKEEEEARRLARSAKLKRLLDEHKQKQLENETTNSRSSDKPASANPLILQVYRARDQQYLEKRKQMLSAKINEAKSSAPPVMRHSPITESTLLKETKAWLDKIKSTEPKTNRTIFYIKDLPTRSGWRSCDFGDSHSY